MRAQCLEGWWALATGQDASVWGGLSEDERRQLRQARRRAGKAPTEVVQERPDE